MSLYLFIFNDNDVSSLNSLIAASNKFSPSSTCPLGIFHAPTDLFFHLGPPFFPNKTCISLSTIIGITMMTFYLQLCIYNWFTYLFYFILIGINLSIYRCERKEADF